MHNSYEKMTFYKAPRGRSKKIRKYEHVDLTKEFEIRQAQRNEVKQRRLEELYADHDLKALGISDILTLNKAVDRKDLTEEQIQALDVQEEAQRKMLQTLKKDRSDLVAEFDDESDLKKKVLI